MRNIDKYTSIVKKNTRIKHDLVTNIENCMKHYVVTNLFTLVFLQKKSHKTRFYNNYDPFTEIVIKTI